MNAPATKTAAKGAKAETAPYTVLSHLDHDGAPYEVGDEVELTAAQAEPLLGSVVKPARTSAG